MNLELILKDVTDPVLRENFSRILNAVGQSEILGPDLHFLEFDVSYPSLSYAVPHGLKYQPKDVFLLSAIGDQNFYFRYDQFDQTSIYIAAHGKVRIRCLIGQFAPKGRRLLTDTQLPFVAPNISTSSGTPLGSGSDGWAFIADSQYTQSSPLLIPANTRTKLPNNAAGALTNFVNAPANASSWWDAPHATFWPSSNGDFYSFRLNVVVVPSINNKTVTLDYSIGSPNMPWTRSKSLTSGAGIPSRFSETMLAPVTPSAFSNGFAFYLTSECDVKVYGINLTVVRDFKK